MKKDKSLVRMFLAGESEGPSEGRDLTINLIGLKSQMFFFLLHTPSPVVLSVSGKVKKNSTRKDDKRCMCNAYIVSVCIRYIFFNIFFSVSYRVYETCPNAITVIQFFNLCAGTFK